MPPQQGDGLLDFVDGADDFRAHNFLVSWPGTPGQPGDAKHPVTEWSAVQYALIKLSSTGWPAFAGHDS
jgi:hypothetical protein